MFNLNNILSFTKLLNKFQDVKRTIYHQGKDTSENDVEHSYQLAMLAWYISDSNSLDLNKSLLIEYALIYRYNSRIEYNRRK